MPGSATLYGIAAIAFVVLVAVFWLQPQRRSMLIGHKTSSSAMLLLVSTGVALCVWSALLERPENTYERQSAPIAIVIAFDLSPSMQAVPNPEFDGELPPRFERGKTALLTLFRTLEERRQPVIVSVLGFARNAEIIMGWDQSTAQVREILQYAVAPDLFGTSGTSIEAAVKSINQVFGMLPEAVRGDSRKIAIIVSDGEDTMRASSFDYATAALAASGFDTIALQTGLLDRSEGLPVYGSVGEFAGFRSMRGEIFTVPDVGAMTAIAEAPAGRGLYVRAESLLAVERMLQFVVEDRRGGGTPDAAWLSTFGMFAVVSMLCVVILR